jgi:phosphatidylglycerophosphatase A
MPGLSNPEEFQPVVAQPGPAVWIGTAGGCGYAPVAPGTFGSAAAVGLFLAAAWLPAAGLALMAMHVVLVVVVSLVGIWAAGRCEQFFGQEDDGRIVIDEVAGQLIALTPIVALGNPGSQPWWILVVTAFVAFRVFDIWKPGPVRWAEQHFEGGLGVMADDLLAGAMGAVVVAALSLVLLSESLGCLPGASGCLPGASG